MSDAPAAVTSPAATLDDARGVALIRLERLLLFAVPFALLAYAAPRLTDHGIDAATVLSIVGQLVVTAMVLRARRLDAPSTRTFTVLFALAWLALQGLVLHGPEIGVGALMIGTMVVGAVFHGRRSAPLVGAAVLGTFALGGTLHVRGVGVALGATIRPTTGLVEWLRAGSALAIVGSALGMLVVRVLELLERERRAAEHALARERLEHEERARAETALERAQRAEALGRLAGGIAHDINNALAVILGNAEVLAASAKLSRRDAAIAATIAQAAESAGETTKQLLALGRRDVGADGSCDANEVVTSLCALLDRSFPATIRIETALADRAEVGLRRGALEQVLLNLALNARDAMPDGGTLRFETDLPISDGTRDVVLRVRDDGHGMDESVRARVFDPYFTTKSPDRGNGLGLSMVHALVTGAGGTVQLDSRPGGGSCFTLVLPRASSESIPKAVSGSVPLDLGGLRVLVVEDDSGVRGMLADALRAEDTDVVEAADGDVALARIREEGAFDVLLTDAVFPCASVDDVIAAFVARNPGMPVLVASGYVELPALRDRIAVGEVRFLQKPFTRRALRDALVEAARVRPRPS